MTDRASAPSHAARWVRRTGGGLIRRFGLLPEGDPDGLGDDAALRGTSLPFAVMVYFADTPRNLYQLRQWYQPLQSLDGRHRVGIVCLDSRTAAAIRAECSLPVVCVGRIATLEDLVSRSDISLALYVNHNVRNLLPLRFATMLHAYLGHGESDKVSSASNQVKAYDFVLVAGEARRDHLRRTLMRYDVDAHVRMIGRPQLDEPGRPAQSATERPTVLYAPTWEGAQPGMAYSSVISHGEPLLRSLLTAGTFTVVYRPHPRLGANLASFATADQKLRALVRQYEQSDPSGAHRVDVSTTWNVRHDPADLLISDISAVASDWMTTGKPIIVTVPVASEAILDATTVLSAAPSLAAADAGRAAELVTRELGGGDSAARRRWVEYTMGDTAQGASMTRFLTICDELVAVRHTELVRLAAQPVERPAGEPG